MENKFYSLVCLFLGLVLTACDNNDSRTEGVKIPEHKLQVFEINADSDTSIITHNKALLIVPHCAFEAEGKIRLEFAEFYNPADFAEARLTTTDSEGRVLESAGMFYFSATDEAGNLLDVNTDCQPLLRVGTSTILPNAKRYSGKIENGIVVWGEEEAMEKWLCPVPLKGLKLYADPDKVYRAKPTKHALKNQPEAIFMQDPGNLLFCGLEQEIVDTLYSPVFENTLIATIEFELRMKIIHLSCSEEVLQIYLSNLDKNLWEADLLAYEYLKEKNSPYAQNFFIFSEQKLTKVKNANKVHEVYLKQITTAYEVKELLYYTMTFNSSGWFNCDALSRDSELFSLKEKIELIAPSDKLEFVSVSLIQKKYNSLYNLSRVKGSLTFSADGLVAADREVLVYAIASDGNQSYTATQEITIGEKENYQLKLEKSTFDVIKSKLSEYGQAREENRFNLVENPACCYYEYDYAH